MPDITGVRVHLSDRDDHRGPVLHEAGRKHLVDDGDLHIYDEHGDRIAAHSSMEWGWAELVYAEPAPARVTITNDTTPIKFWPETPGFALYSAPTPQPTPAERVEAADRELVKARRAQFEAERALHDAQRDLADERRRDLDEAA